MTLSVTHRFINGVPDSTDPADNTKTKPSAWNDTHKITLDSGNVIGRKSSGTGDAELLAGSDLLSIIGIAAFLDALGYTPANQAGDTFTGPVILPGLPGSALAAAPKQYVDSRTIAFYPSDYGAVGDGVTDDTAALNAMFNALRAQIAALNDFSTKYQVDLSGTYACGNVNVTGINSVGTTIRGGRIKGIVAGKPIFDMVGSRGVRLKDVTFFGDSTNIPSCAYQAARCTTPQLAFCDWCEFDNVCTLGFYSVSSVLCYGQESSRHNHCRYFNYSPTGRAGVFEGYDAIAFTSDYQTVITGGTSYINNDYNNCSFGYLPIGNQFVITGITKANPAVVTVSAPHNFNNGDSVVISLVAGMTQINNIIATVANKTSTTFQLSGVDSSAYSTYTSGGLATRRASNSPIYVARAEGHRFKCCYCFSYGQSTIELGFPDSVMRSMDNMLFDFLMEGGGIPAHYKWNVGANACSVYGLQINQYNTNAYSSFFSIVETGGSITFTPFDIFVTTHDAAASLPLCDNYAKYSFLGGRLTYPNDVTTSLTIGQYTGSFSQRSGFTTQINPLFVDQNDAPYTPASVASTSGTITTVGAKSGTVRQLGKVVFFTANVTITTNGTGAGGIDISLPVAAASTGGPWIVFGRENGVSAKGLQGFINNSATSVRVWNAADGTYPGANSANLLISGWYLKA